MLPKAHKTKAFEWNNVLDLANRISFFWHKTYEFFFLAILLDVLSSVVTGMKRFLLKISSINWRQRNTIRTQGDAPMRVLTPLCSAVLLAMACTSQAQAMNLTEPILWSDLPPVARPY